MPDLESLKVNLPEPVRWPLLALADVDEGNPARLDEIAQMPLGHGQKGGSLGKAERVRRAHSAPPFSRVLASQMRSNAVSNCRTMAASRMITRSLSWRFNPLLEKLADPVRSTVPSIA